MKDAGYLGGLLLDKQVIDPMSIEQKVWRLNIPLREFFTSFFGL